MTSIFSKEYWTKDSIAARKKKNKEKTKAYYEKIYGKKNNDVKVKNNIKKTGATIEAAGGGADKFGTFNSTEFDYEYTAYNTDKDTGEPKISKSPITRNVLHDYASVNHKITLAVMDAAEVNYPGLVLTRGPKYPVAQTAGKTGGEIIGVEQGGDLNLEFLIDNLSIKSVVSHNPKSRGTQQTQVEFDVIEPYSLGLFFQALKVQSIKAYGEDADYIHVPFCLVVEFIGYDDEGEKITGSASQKLRDIKRVIPIALRQVQLGASFGGSRYSCVGYPWNETSMRDHNIGCKKDMTIRGSTVGEILQWGENSLTNMLNEQVGGKAKKKGEDVEKIDFDDTAIVFPEPFGLRSDELVPDSDVIMDLNKDRSATVAYDNPNEQRSSDFSRRRTDTQLQELFSIGGNFVNVTNFQVPNNEYDGEDKGGLRLDQRSGGNFVGNEIGKSKMFAHDMALNTIGKKFTSRSKVINKQGKVHLNSKISANFKADEVTLHVKKGTKVTDIIETVIIFSEYGQEIANYQKKNSKSPMIPWFRIHPQCWQLRDSFAFRKMNRHPRVYAYNVVPFQVHETAGGSMVDATAFGKGMDLLRQTVHKKYNYLYTGVNEDILNFDLNYQFSFFDLQRERPSSNSNSSIFPGQGVRVETDAAVNRNSTVVLNANKNEIKDGAGANETSSEDLKSPTMGLEFTNPAIQTAIQFNENIMNSQVDLLNLTLSIVGDTYFLPNSGMGNLVIQNVFSTNPDIEFGKREMDYLNGMCHVEVFFVTPVDIDEKTGDMKSVAIAGGDGTAVKLGTFSAIYRVTQVESTFRGGKFEQDLTLVAPQSLQIREDESTNTSAKTKEKNQDSNNNNGLGENFGLIENNGGIGDI